VLWNVENDQDPGLATQDFSFGKYYTGLKLFGVTGDYTPVIQNFPFENYYQPASKQLLLCDQSNIYALQLGRDGGKFAWETEMSSLNAGSLDYEKSFFYEVSGMHKPLGIQYFGNSLLAFGPDGVVMVDPSSGQAKWVHEWDFDIEEIRYLPEIIGNKLSYLINDDFTLVDLTTGETLLQVNADDKSVYFSPQKKFAIMLEGDEVSEFDIQ